MQAVIYCRVSTVEQASNLSLPTQEKACREYCTKEGYSVGAIFIDRGESAKTTNRPEFLRLLEHCREHRGKLHAVVVYSLTRFSRNSVDHHSIAALLRGHGITLRSVTEPIDDSPAGRFMEGVVAAMSQFDNDVRSHRVTAGMKAAIQAGRWPWIAPLGYVNGPRPGPSLVPDAVRAPLVREAFELVAGGRTVQETLAVLRQRGLTTRTGKHLGKQTLHDILHNRVFAGWVDAKVWRECVKGDFHPIIPDELFALVQRRLGRKDQSLYAMERHVVDDDFPLRRFVRCSTCDTVLTGSRSTGRGGRRYAFYHCPKGHVRASKATLEAAFLEILDAVRPTEDFAAMLKASVLTCWAELERSAADERNRHQSAVRTLEDRLRRLDAAWLFEGRIDERTYVEQRDRLRGELAIAEMNLSASTIEHMDVRGLLDFGVYVLQHSAALWTSAVDAHARMRLQWTVFPSGLSWDGVRLGNAVTSLAFYGWDQSDASCQEWCATPLPTWNRIAEWLRSVAALKEAA
jgi:site-specific DNA recombinase